MPLVGDVAYQDQEAGWDPNGMDRPPNVFVGIAHLTRGGKGTSFGLVYHDSNAPLPMSGMLAGGNFAYVGGHVAWASAAEMEVPENQQDWGWAMRWPLPK